MNTPTYIWVCHKCGQSNQPDTDKCAACGFPAVASADDITPAAKNKMPQSQSGISSNIWLFFPEGLIAGLLALATPFWAIKLLANGHFLAAFTLLAGIAACGYSFIWSIRHQRKYLAYLVIICFLVLALGLDSSLSS